MRLIGEFKNERQAFGLQTFLQSQKIPSIYELAKNPSSQESIYRLWAVEEDDFEKAYAFYQEWLRDPSDARFEAKKEKLELKEPSPVTSTAWKVRPGAPKASLSWSLNNIFILICIFLFIKNILEERTAIAQKGIIAVENGLTPLEKNLLFDYPLYLVNIEKFFEEYPVQTPEEIKKLPSEAQACFEKVKNAPTWKGVADLIVSRNWKAYDQLPPGTLFGKIRQGEVWRLLTPVFLHGSALHLLFNMAWLWILGRFVEQRVGALRYLILSLIIGIGSNVAQYLVSGPEFLGYSGIIIGLVGFIWMRQKLAPWEGYPLHPAVIRFITIYVLVLLGLGIVSMALDFFHVTEMYANIANTAHIVGGLLGIACARLLIFQRNPR